MLLVAALVFIFIIGLFWFRSGGEENSVEENISSTVVSDSRSQTQTNTQVTEPAMTPGQVDTTELVDVSGGSSSGEASREIQDGFFRHVVKAYMPAPGENYFYEGWLVRQSPFDFFSTGDMVQNESGEWVLEWFGEFGETYSDYPLVVITIEPDDGDPDPAAHILEGEF